MKRLISLLLALVLAVGMVAVPSAAAEDSGVAAIMRLTKTEGTVTVKNASDRAVTQRKEMRLYNGYTLSTEAASYAYLSLDASKAAKLDASSAAKVSKLDKKLEIEATAGKLFFNVPVALAPDESMNIRTSTMVTGIRGTAGWVHVVDRYTTRIALLEGVVTINSQDPFTGEDRSVTITGGQIATIIRHEKAIEMAETLCRERVIIEENIVDELTKPGQVVEELREDGVPGFVAEEVSNDTDLQERISESTRLEVRLIILDARERVKEDEKQAQEKAERIEKLQEQLLDNRSEQPESPFAAGESTTRTEVIYETETIIKEVMVPGPSTETVSVPKVLYDPSEQAIEDAFEDTETVIVIGVDDMEYDDETSEQIRTFAIQNVDMEEDQILYLVSSELSVDQDWDVEGTVILMDSRLTNAATINVSGTLEVGNGADMYNYGTINVIDKLVVGGGASLDNRNDESTGIINVNGEMVIEEDGRVSNEDTINVNSKDSLYIAGVLVNYHYVNIGAAGAGKVVVESTGTLVNADTDASDTSIVVGGYYQDDLYSGGDGYDGEDEGGPVATNYGSLLVNHGLVTNQCTFYNLETIENYGQISNLQRGGRSLNRYSYCAFNNAGSIINYPDSSLWNSAYFYNYGDISASGNAHGLINGKDERQNKMGTLYLHDGIITHSGGGTGCALYFDDNLTNFDIYADSTRLQAESKEQLVGMAEEQWFWEKECDYSYDESADLNTETAGALSNGWYCFHYYQNADKWYVDVIHTCPTQ